MIKFGVRKITQVGVHKTNWRWRDDSGKSMERYCGYTAFKREITLRNRKTNGIEVQS